MMAKYEESGSGAIRISNRHSPAGASAGIRTSNRNQICPLGANVSVRRSIRLHGRQLPGCNSSGGTMAPPSALKSQSAVRMTYSAVSSSALPISTTLRTTSPGAALNSNRGGEIRAAKPAACTQPQFSIVSATHMMPSWSACQVAGRRWSKAGTCRSLSALCCAPACATHRRVPVGGDDRNHVYRVG
jgi:hypothetical protein